MRTPVRGVPERGRPPVLSSPRACFGRSQCWKNSQFRGKAVNPSALAGRFVLHDVCRVNPYARCSWILFLWMGYRPAVGAPQLGENPDICLILCHFVSFSFGLRDKCLTRRRQNESPARQNESRTRQNETLCRGALGAVSKPQLQGGRVSNPPLCRAGDEGRSAWGRSVSSALASCDLLGSGRPGGMLPSTRRV